MTTIENEVWVDDITKGKNWFNSDLKEFLSNDRFQGESMFLRFEGYVGNRPSNNNDKIHEDDTWAIDVYGESGNPLTSFLYVSKYEYDKDIKELSKFI